MKQLLCLLTNYFVCWQLTLFLQSVYSESLASLYKVVEHVGLFSFAEYATVDTMMTCQLIHNTANTASFTHTWRWSSWLKIKFLQKLPSAHIKLTNIDHNVTIDFCLLTYFLTRGPFFKMSKFNTLPPQQCWYLHIGYTLHNTLHATTF